MTMRGSILRQTVKVSPKFQVVIPQPIREALGLAPGARIQVFQYENRIEFIPEKTLRRMRGFLKGIDTSVRRDRDRV
jgi:AbrB family looped-hinge helix DNA binding protein